MKSKILEKPEKIVGYVLLIIGLIVVILPPISVSPSFHGRFGHTKNP